ncbi:Hsp70 family protein, partial [Rhodocaloribacter sp.]
IDANGILSVSAKDKATGKEQTIRIEASSGLTEAEIEKMRADARAHAAEDKQRRRQIEVMNQADSLIYTSEKNLKEYGDKLPAEKRAKIEAALERLKEAHKAQNVEEAESAMQQLNEAWTEASQDLYQARQGAAPEGEAAPAGGEEVKDVDFEVVDEGEAQ